MSQLLPALVLLGLGSATILGCSPEDQDSESAAGAGGTSAGAPSAGNGGQDTAIAGAATAGSASTGGGGAAATGGGGAGAEAGGSAAGSGQGGSGGANAGGAPTGVWLSSAVPPAGPPVPAQLEDGTVTVEGLGSGFVYGQHLSKDHFQLVFQTLRGDGAISALIEIDQDDSCYGGVVLREGLGEVDRFVGFVALLNSHPATYDGRVDLNFSARLVPEAHTAQDGNYNRNQRWDKVPGPHWVKVERLGADVNGYSSQDGTSWKLLKTYTAVLQKEELVVGVMATPASCSVRFENVTVSKP